jgi:hypothetical protein
MKRTFLIFSLTIAASFAFACGSTSGTNKPDTLRTGSPTGGAPASNPQFAETPAANTSSPVAGTIYPITGREAESENDSLAGESKSSEAEIKTKYEPLEAKPQANPQASPTAQNQTSGQTQGQTPKPSATKPPTR